MKKRSLRYAGDKAVRALLERYACPTVYIVVMHSGVTQAPIMGRLVAMEVLDDVRVDLLKDSRLSRFEGKRETGVSLLR